MKPANQPLINWDETPSKQSWNGNLVEFNQLVQSFQDIAYRRAYSLLGDRVSAEDVVQESFLKAYESMARFRGGSFRAWLLKIVTNTSYDLIRQKKRRPEQTLFPEDDHGEEYDSPGWLADPSPSLEAIIEQKELSNCLIQSLGELPEIYRNVLVQVDLYEMDYTEVAEKLQAPLGTLKSRLARARLQMKGKIEACQAKVTNPIPTRLLNHGDLLTTPSYHPGFSGQAI